MSIYSYSQVYIGSIKSHHPVHMVDDHSGLKEDHLVAVNLADAANEPAIARVVKVSANDVVVQLLKGSCFSVCKPWKLQSIRYSFLISHFHIESIYFNLSFYHLYL